MPAMPKPQPIKHKDGSVVWRVRYRADGSSNPVSSTFDDYASAARFAQLVEQVGGTAARTALQGSAVAASGTPTVAEACEHYVALKEPSLSPESAEKYRSSIRRYIVPALGLYPVDMVTSEMLSRWATGLPKMGKGRRSKDLSPKTCQLVRTILSASLEAQVREGAIPTNPLRGIKIRRGEAAEPVFLSQNQVATLVQATPERWRPLVLTLVGTGMRIGEAIALNVDDVDLDTDIPVIRVTKTWRQVNGGYPAPPKTAAGRRTVSLPRSLVKVLRPLTEHRTGDAPLFTNTRGKRIHVSVLRNRVWHPSVERAGLSPAPRIHDLRHTHASQLIARGVPLTVIQRRLGHASIQVTSDTYGHLAPEALVQAASAIDLSLTQAVPEVESEAGAVDEIEGEVLEERQIEG